MNTYKIQLIKSILAKVQIVPSESLESETVEFKSYRDEKALHNCRDLAKEITALANHRGGEIIVGVQDSSNVPDSDWQTQLLGIEGVDLVVTKERLNGKLSPPIGITVWEIQFENMNFVVITVPHRPDKIVATTSGKACIRDGKSSRPMTSAEIESKVKGLTSFDWTGEVLPGIEILTVLDKFALDAAVEDYRSKRQIEEPVPYAHYLESVNATINGNLTRAGLLFLGRKEEIRKFLGIQEFRFSWKKPNGDLLLNDIWEGNIWNTLIKATGHFEQCQTFRDFTVSGQNISVPSLDPLAFHEAYLNALVHRDYSKEGMITATYTGDQMMITSPGSFFGGITAENIVTSEPKHRNKCLARILMTHNFVDRAGVGIQRMSIHSLMYGRGLPVFEEDEDSVRVTMDGTYLRAPITVLSVRNRDTWGIAELLLINLVYGVGGLPVNKLEKMLARVTRAPWQAIEEAVRQISQVELCGTSDGIYIRVVGNWREFFQVEKWLRVGSSSQKYVKLYRFLKRHETASNHDISEHLDVAHSSSTSRFLRDTAFVRRSGIGRKSRWQLIDDW